MGAGLGGGAGRPPGPHPDAVAQPLLWGGPRGSELFEAVAVGGGGAAGGLNSRVTPRITEHREGEGTGGTGEGGWRWPPGVPRKHRAGVEGSNARPQGDLVLTSRSSGARKGGCGPAGARPLSGGPCLRGAPSTAPVRAPGPQGGSRPVSSLCCSQKRAQEPVPLGFTEEHQQSTAAAGQSSLCRLQSSDAEKQWQGPRGLGADAAFLPPRLASSQEGGTCWMISQLLLGEEAAGLPARRPLRWQSTCGPARRRLLCAQLSKQTAPLGQ